MEVDASSPIISAMVKKKQTQHKPPAFLKVKNPIIVNQANTEICVYVILTAIAWMIALILELVY